MRTKGVPKRLWDYGLVWASEITNRTARGPEARTPLEAITGNTPDISEWLDFDFYDWCWFWQGPTHELTESKAEIGKVLGVAHRIGSDLCYWILTDTGRVIARTTVQRVTKEDLLLPHVQLKMQVFEDKIKPKMESERHRVNSPAEGLTLDDEEDPNDEPEGETKPEQDDFTEETYDAYLGAELLIPSGDQFIVGRVMKRTRDDNGNPVGQRNSNPILDTRVYEVQFGDGSTVEYGANLVAENMMAQSDPEGNRHMIFREIVDHRVSDDAIKKEEGFTIGYNGNVHPKKTTKGWDISVEWRDGSTSWLPLRDVKDSNPLELAQYAIANGIQEEPAFKWWVQEIMRKKKRIIAKIKTKYWKTTHKFGIEIPKSVEHALRIDYETGTDYWRKAIEKEMKNVRVAFQRYTEGLDGSQGPSSLQGYQEIKCHMIFDIKMDGDFTRKARFVAGGHTTEAPSSSTYSSVVSRESVRIAFLVAALNDLEVFAADIGNAYLNAPCREKIWTRAGKEFGSDEGCIMIIVRALYGLKTSGAAWRAAFAQKLVEMGYKSSKADPDVWIRQGVKPDGFRYYEILLVYVDDILCVSHQPEKTMDEIKELYRLKDDTVGPPNRYLGANIGKFQLSSGFECWSASARDYVKSAVRNMEDVLSQDDVSSKLRNRVDRPLPLAYRPEVDVSPLLDATMTTRFQNGLGVLRWIVELGRIDIMTEVSMLSAHNAMPREGHLEGIYHVFSYLKGHENSKLVFDPAYPVIDERRFKDVDWKDFYPDAVDELPPGMPEPLGLPVEISCFVDADHAGNLLTRRSQSGVLIFLNKAPIVWYSKRQNTVESSTFGSEFVAMRIATDLIVSLRYKLRMFGVPLTGAANVFCDNQGVVNNTTSPESVLGKKHNQICYHRVREAAAAGIIRIAKEDTETNLADILTKPLGLPKRKFLLQRILY